MDLPNHSDATQPDDGDAPSVLPPPLPLDESTKRDPPLPDAPLAVAPPLRIYHVLAWMTLAAIGWNAHYSPTHFGRGIGL